ncbi:MAG: hypothetical protein LBC93_06410 [Synergistaceae bacterium]|jgi:lipid-A-disaccharide synthase|nr:hypothetical protein [Synergistaceae bacterium]
MRVAVLTNGPGELWGWARPVIAELRQRGHSVSLWLLPCQFASGYERTAASTLGVDKLEGPSGPLWTWRALGQEKTDCVLQLGGDLAFGRRIAAYSGAPLICYAYGWKKGMEHAKVFTAYPNMAAAIDSALGRPTAQAVGDLVKDALALERGTLKWGETGLEKASARLLLFPGSRPSIRRMTLGWLMEFLRNLKGLAPEIRVGTLFPPFVPENEFSAWSEAGLHPLKAEAGTAMKSADYALTQPGTNTLELMHCGLPALVAAPLDFLKVAPAGGLAGYLFGVPALGPAFKEWKIRKSLERYSGFVAWPNRIAGRMVLEEAVGDVKPKGVAVRVASALKDREKLARVRAELLTLSGVHGAALRLCDAVDQGQAPAP